MTIKVCGFPGLPPFLDRIKVKKAAVAFGITEDQASLRLQKNPFLLIPELEDNAPKVPLLPKYEEQDMHKWAIAHNKRIRDKKNKGKLNEPREKEGLQSHRESFSSEPKAANSS